MTLAIKIVMITLGTLHGKEYVCQISCEYNPSPPHPWGVLRGSQISQ